MNTLHKYGFFILMAIIASFNCSNSSQETFFSSEERQLISSLIFNNANQVPDDPTNAYDTNTAAAALGAQFYWDNKFSGIMQLSGKILDTSSSAGSVTSVTGGISVVGATDSDTTLAVLSTAGLSVGMGISGTDIVAGTTITALAAAQITISTAAQGTTASVTFTAGDYNKVSCATCHNPNLGFVDRTSGNKGQTDEASLGVNGFMARLAPTVVNSYFNEYKGKKAWLWTGNADSAWGLNSRPIEGGPHRFSRMLVADRILNNYIAGGADYDEVFGTPTLTSGDLTTALASCTGSQRGTGADACMTGAASGTATPANINVVFANFMKAIAAYERQVISMNSNLEKWWEGNEGALSNPAKRGLKLFIGKANCIACHNGPALSDADFHNIGIPQTGGFVASSDNGAESGFASLTADNTGQHTTFRGDGAYSDDTSSGSTQLALIPTSTAGQEAFSGAFKTPGLREISKRAPYMHTGQFRDLWEVVNFYNFGGGESGFTGTKDARIIPRNMTNEEMLDLVAFLNELDGETLDSSITERPTIP